MFKARLKAYFADTSGATAIEYSLIAGLLALAIVAAVTSVGEAANDRYQSIADAEAFN